MSGLVDLNAVNLQNKLMEVISQELEKVTNFDVVFEALQRVMVLHMAAICPECRRRWARELKQNLPAMVNRAGQFAAQWAQEHGGADNTACH